MAVASYGDNPGSWTTSRFIKNEWEKLCLDHSTKLNSSFPISDTQPCPVVELLAGVETHKRLIKQTIYFFS